MRVRTKVYAISTAAFFACLLALIPQAPAAVAITLTPPAQYPGGVVFVTGSGFVAARNVGIGFGAAKPITGEIVINLVNGTTRDANFTYRPIKPGSVEVRAVRNDGYEESVVDTGAGELWYYGGGYWGTLNYAAGSYHATGRASNLADWTFYATYTSYQYNLTSFACINTTASGTFSTNITVPAVANGNYNVTVIDAIGNVAVATFKVDNTIPEALPFAATMLLSALAVATSSLHLRKRHRILEQKR